MIDYFSGIVALFAFVVVILIGLVRGDEPMEIVREALVGMVVFLFVGKVLGIIARKIIAEEIEEEIEAEENVRDVEMEKNAEGMAE